MLLWFMEDDMILFENKAVVPGVTVLNNQQIAQKAHAILQQIEIENTALASFQKIIKEHVSA